MPKNRKKKSKQAKKALPANARTGSTQKSVLPLIYPVLPNNIFTNYALKETSVNKPSISPEEINSKLKNFYATKLVIRRLFYPDIPIPFEKCFINLWMMPSAEYTAQIDKFVNTPSQTKKDEVYEYNNSLYEQPSILIPANGVIPYNINVRRNIEYPMEGTYQTYNELLCPIVKMLILGAAGIGKSTLSEYYTHLWASSQFSGAQKGGLVNYEWVFRIPLRNLTEERYPAHQNLRPIHIIEKECLAKVFEKTDNFLSESDRNKLETVLHQAFNQRRVLIILDGFDEFPENSPEHLCRLVKAFLSITPIIVTSRPYNLHALKHDYQFQEQHRLEITGFMPDDIQHYINNFFENLSSPKKDEAVKLLDFLSRNSNIVGVCRIPINLELLCSAWEKQPIFQDEQNICTVSAIYTYVVQSLSLRYLEKKGQNIRNIDELKILEYCALPLGFLDHLGSKSAHDHRSFVKLSISREYIENIHGESQSMISEQKLFGFIRPNNPNGEYDGVSFYYFNHLTFRDFFAARYIAACLQQITNTKASKISYFHHQWKDPGNQETSVEDFVQQHQLDSPYESVWCFIVGLLSKAEDILTLKYFFSLLFKLSDQIEISRVLLLIRCLEEAHELAERLPSDFWRYLSQWVDLAITEDKAKAFLYTPIWERLKGSRFIFLHEEIQQVFYDKLDSPSDQLLLAMLNIFAAIRQPLPSELSQRLLACVYKEMIDVKMRQEVSTKLANLCINGLLSIQCFENIYQNKDTLNLRQLSIAIEVIVLATYRDTPEDPEFFNALHSFVLDKESDEELCIAATVIYGCDRELTCKILEIEKKYPALKYQEDFKAGPSKLAYILSIGLNEKLPIVFRLDTLKEYLSLFVILKSPPKLSEDLLIWLISVVKGTQHSLENRFYAYYLLGKFCIQHLGVFENQFYALFNVWLEILKKSSFKGQKRHFLELLSPLHPRHPTVLPYHKKFEEKKLLFLKENFEKITSPTIRSYVAVYLCLNAKFASEAELISTLNIVITNAYPKEEFWFLTAFSPEKTENIKFVNAFYLQDCSRHFKNLQLNQNTSVLSLYHVLTHTSSRTILKFCVENLRTDSVKYLIAALVMRSLSSGKAIYMDEEGLRYFEEQRYKSLPVNNAQQEVFMAHINWSLSTITKKEVPRLSKDTLDSLGGIKKSNKSGRADIELYPVIPQFPLFLSDENGNLRDHNDRDNENKYKLRRRPMAEAQVLEKKELKLMEVQESQLTISKLRSELFADNLMSVPEGMRVPLGFVQRGEHAKLKRLIDNEDSRLLQKDSHGNTLLHYAAFMGQESCAIVLKGKLKVAQENKFGLTAMHVAAFFGHQGILKHLEHAEQKWVTCYVQGRKVNCSPLHLAILNNQVQTVHYFLDRFNNVQELRVGSVGNILHLAVLSRNPWILKELLYHKKVLALETADLYNEENKSGFTPLRLAAHIHNLGAIHYLTQCTKVKLNIQSSTNGYTVLHEAADIGSSQIIKAVLGSMSQSEAVQELLNLRSSDSTGRFTAQHVAKAKFHEFAEACLDNTALETWKNLRSTHVPHTEHRIKNLIFQGGGPKGIAYVGALSKLWEVISEIKTKVERVAGTSAGAITAMGVALELDPGDLEKELNGLEVKTLLEGYDAEVIKGMIKEVQEQMGTGTLGKGTVLDIVKKVYGCRSNFTAGVFAAWNRQEIFNDFSQMTGLCSGDTFLGWIEGVVTRALSKNKEAVGRILKIAEKDFKHLTFGQLRQLIDEGESYKHLHVVSCCITDNKKLVDFNSEDRQWDHIRIVDAVRASMSIPGLFKPYEIKHQMGHETITKQYVDGGILMNYPIKLFDKIFYLKRYLKGDDDYEVFNEETLGFRLVDKQSSLNEPNLTKIDSLFDFISAVVKAFYDAEVMIADFEHKHTYRTIEVDSCGVGTLDFDITPEQKQALVKAGHKAVEGYFAGESEQKLDLTSSPAENIQTEQNVASAYGSPISQQVGKFAAPSQENSMREALDQGASALIKK